MKKDTDKTDRYTELINRTIDFIESNLSEELSLDQISRCAGLSESHFHKLFSKIMKETPGHFIQRLRIERSATLLVQYPQRSITDIAFSCGFASSASFTRTFREYFSVTPSTWRDPGIRDGVRTEKYRELIRSQMFEDNKTDIEARYDTTTMSFTWTVFRDSKEFSTVVIEQLEETQIAYVRHIGPYMMDQNLFRSLYNRLYTWAVPRKLVTEKTRLYNIYHDDPMITGFDRLRLSIGIDIPQETETGGEVSSMTIPGGDYAAASFEIDREEYMAAWAVMFFNWLPQSGYACGEGIPFEVPLQDPEDHPEGKHRIKIYIPVIPR